MAKKIKVKTKAVFNGQPIGSTIELDEKTARKYESLKYLEIIEEVKPKAKKSTSATKKPSQKTSAKKETKKDEE